MTFYLLFFPWIIPLALILFGAIILFGATQKIPGMKKFRRFIAPTIALFGFVLVMAKKPWGAALLLLGLLLTVADLAVPDSFPTNDDIAKKRD